MLADKGYPIHGIEIRIVGEDGNVVPENTVGEIQIRGESVTSGFFNNPKATRKAFQDAWLKTGDMGIVMQPGPNKYSAFCDNYALSHNSKPLFVALAQNIH